ncbi:coiled-coil domain-containing protein-domain-containing protein [Hypomontagnella monticulosa]|nr:coiled-coil domain-containing protein-domain-containing protein [Hypomontagnella monticulosa]
MASEGPAVPTMSPEAPPSPPLSSTYAKPRPRPPKSPAHSARIRVQNRRREYLERNPKYFDSLEHELADPLLYDALIRRFQSPEEREKEGRVKGYSRVLEVDLLRGEAKLAHLRSQNPLPESSTATATGESWIPRPASQDADAFIREYAMGSDEFADDSPVPRDAVGGNGDSNGSGSNSDSSEPSEPPIKGLPRRPETREEGRERWDDFLRRRFVLGRDDDFDYRAVDENDELDVLERREQEDAWFDDEDPGWASDAAEDQGGGGGGKSGEKKLEGETGIQDF